MAKLSEKEYHVISEEVLIALFKSPWNELLKKPGPSKYREFASLISTVYCQCCPIYIQTNLEHRVMSNLRDKSGVYFIKFGCVIVASRFELKLLTDVKLLDYVYNTIF